MGGTVGPDWVQEVVEQLGDIPQAHLEVLHLRKELEAAESRGFERAQAALMARVDDPRSAATTSYDDIRAAPPPTPEQERALARSMANAYRPEPEPWEPAEPTLA